jgi:hypothetical protein
MPTRRSSPPLVSLVGLLLNWARYPIDTDAFRIWPL